MPLDVVLARLRTINPACRHREYDQGGIIPSNEAMPLCAVEVASDPDMGSKPGLYHSSRDLKRWLMFGRVLACEGDKKNCGTTENVEGKTVQVLGC
jgi:hypothetical protein